MSMQSQQSQSCKHIAAVLVIWPKRPASQRLVRGSNLALGHQCFSLLPTWTSVRSEKELSWVVSLRIATSLQNY